MTKKKDSKLFLLDVIESFLLTKEPREPRTYQAYSSVLRGSVRGTKPSLGLPLAAYFQNRRIGSISADEVSAWFAQRVRGGAQDTKSRISRSSRAFFTFAHERGYTFENLGAGIEAFRPGGPRVDWLEWEDVHRVLAVIDEFRLEFAAAWLFFTGCRVSEAVAALQSEVRLRETAGLYEWVVPETKTHRPRSVWLPDALVPYIEQSREMNKPAATWPLLWDCEGRGFGRIENPANPISARTINSALARAERALSLQVSLTAHIAKHTYCTNWIRKHGQNETAMEKLSRQVGTSVANLRKTYIHHDFSENDWEDIRGFGSVA